MKKLLITLTILSFVVVSTSCQKKCEASYAGSSICFDTENTVVVEYGDTKVKTTTAEMDFDPNPIM